MAKELEALAAEAAAGIASEGVSGPSPTPESACPNCGHLLYGRFCSQCGQSSDFRHRSILHLIWEAFEGLLHLDGRLWRTVPALFFRPGTLGKDYLEGRVARHVPPFRMFLVALVIFIFSAERVAHQAQHAPGNHTKLQIGLTPGKSDVITLNSDKAGARAEAVVQLRQNAAQRYAERAQIAAERRDAALKDPAQQARAQADYARALRTAAARRDAQLQAAEGLETGKGQSGFFRGLGAAIERPDYYLTVMFEWAHRLAVLLLPIVAAYLALFYAYKRKFYVYDHLIIAMDYLSFLFLIYAAAFLAPDPVRKYALLGAFLWSPVNLFMTLRGAYGSSIAGATIKAAAISLATAFSFGVLLIGLMVFTFYQL
jgi:hypothetical protein